MVTQETLLVTGGRCITQLAKITVDPKLFELTADVVKHNLMKRKKEVCVAHQCCALLLEASTVWHAR